MFKGSFWRWPLRRQLILALGGTTILVGALSGELVRTMETNYLKESFEQQSRKTFSILSATSIDAVVSEDQPLLETIVSQSVAFDPEIFSLSIENEVNEILVEWQNTEISADVPLMSFSEDIVFEEESFGRMNISWNVTPLIHEIEMHVQKMRAFSIGITVALALLIILWVNRLVINPVRKIHRRLTELGRGELTSAFKLNAAQELVLLGESTDVISENLHLKRLREEELEETSRAKSEFMANMSHELRTPLNGVLGMMSLLRDSELATDQRDYVNVAANSGRALLTLINDILDFSKIEAGKLELEAIDFDLRNLVEDSTEPLAEQAHKKGVELACLVKLDVPAVVHGDPTRLRQIVTNLASNAIKFTDEGEVVVRVRVNGSHGDKVCLRFEVQDTGVGISKMARARIFDSFTQADGSTTRRFGGTGLGLAISRQLVERMGGEIGVDSVPGEGSTFWFTIQIEMAEDNALDFVPLDDLSGVRVLIVDDNATNRLVLEYQAQNWQMQPTTAENGPKAIRLLREAVQRNQPYDLMLIDMIMPDMDGLTLSKAIGREGSISDVRRVLLTSLTERGQAAEARDAGVHGYLSKPIRRSQLHNCIATVLGLKSVDNSAMVTRHSIADNEAKIRRHQRILVVDDNEVNQVVAQGMLEKLSYNVDLVSDGQEAVDALEQNHYDLVLMDCQMPVLDGYDATRTIRASEGANRHIPIVALTANAMAGDADKCFTAGMDDYLAKPFEYEALCEKLSKWLSDKQVNQPESMDDRSYAAV
ncbi:MAG: response regulator [Gammaproteobacteria bacterium]|nr:response regulator [Gammaproteobacteria bacterium]